MRGEKREEGGDGWGGKERKGAPWTGDEVARPLREGTAAKKRKRPIVYLSFPPSPSTFSPAEMKKGCGLFVGADLIR